MFGDKDLRNLIEQSGIHRMANGYQVVIRANWTDACEQKPHALDYALILQNEHGTRILGFDNSHAYDGAGEDEPWDHEHKPGMVGQRFRYDFMNAGQLLTDFFERVETYHNSLGLTAEFCSEEEL